MIKAKSSHLYIKKNIYQFLLKELFFYQFLLNITYQTKDLRNNSTVKAICKKNPQSTLCWVKTKGFFQRLYTKHACLLSSIVFNIILEILFTNRNNKKRIEKD